MSEMEKQMNAESMMVDPNELVIDMPVDEAHVQKLMASLKKTGYMIEEVSVWLNGMRIINGFHRTEASKRLGWKAMPCMVRDCTEDEFWDARIIAARPHQAIESQRLSTWVFESWKQTPWCQHENEYQSLVDRVWEHIKRTRDRYLKGYELSEEQQAIAEWLETKAVKWGIPPYEIAEKIQGVPRDTRRRELAERSDLSVAKTNFVVKFAPDRGYHQEVETWVETEVVPNETPRPFRDWLQDNYKEREARENSEHKRREAFLQTEIGKKQAEKERLQSRRDSMRRDIEFAKQQVSNISYSLKDVPEAPAMLAEFAQFVADFAAKHFPGIEIAKPNPVSLDNARLRAENSKLRERVASLERALGSKQAAGELLSGAIAWSSGDLETH